MVIKFLLDTKMTKLLSHYVLFYLRWVDLLNILKTKKSMLFLADDDVILKYNKIGKKVKKLFSVEFDSQLVHDEKWIKTSVKTFEEKVLQNLQTMKFQKKILVIHVSLQFVLIL